MVDLGKYKFKDFNIGNIKSEELFTDAYAKEVYESEHVRTARKRLRVILDARYKKADLHKFIETRCQNLTMTQYNNLLEYYRNSKSFSMEHLAHGKITSRF